MEGKPKRVQLAINKWADWLVVNGMGIRPECVSEHCSQRNLTTST